MLWYRRDARYVMRDMLREYMRDSVITRCRRYFADAADDATLLRNMLYL